VPILQRAITRQENLKKRTRKKEKLQKLQKFSMFGFSAMNF
jgi:hypothetical protein